MKNFYAIALTLLTLGLLSGCGGAGSSSTLAGAVTTITGQVVDGAIAGATCNAYQVNTNGTKGTLAGGPATTDGNGNYTISMSYTGPVIVECKGGSYTDWATGSTVTLLAPANVMSAVVSNASGSVSAQVTPLTHMAASLALKDIASGTAAATAISNANNKIGTYFGGVDIIKTPIIDPTVTGSATGATQAAIDYSLVLAGISQYAKTNNITNPFTLVTALAMDASDGTLDGKEGINQLQLFTTGGAGWMNLSTTSSTTGVSTAITAFQGSTSNISGGTITNTIVTNLTTATGTLPQPIATIAVSPATATLTTAGATTLLTAAANDANGTAVTTVFTWSSSNTGIATVSSTGLVAAIANGTATITASAAGITGMAAITVSISGGNTTTAPTITSFTPISGTVGTSVTISGTNFSATVASNTVSFNGVQATVSSATATQLVVTVPAAATSGRIIVLVGGQTATSATSFTVSAAGGGAGSGTASEYLAKKAVGNQWSLLLTMTVNGAAYPAGTTTTTTTITGASGSGFDYATTSTGAASTTGRLEINAAGDLVGTNSVSGGVTQTYLPATFSVGTTYVQAPVGAMSAMNATVKAFNVTRTVPAGTFTDCLQVDFTRTDPDGTVVNDSVYYSKSAGSTVEYISTSTFPGAGGTLVVTLQLQAGYIANP